MMYSMHTMATRIGCVFYTNYYQLRCKQQHMTGKSTHYSGSADSDNDMKQKYCNHAPILRYSGVRALVDLPKLIADKNTDAQEQLHRCTRTLLLTPLTSLRNTQHASILFSGE